MARITSFDRSTARELQRAAMAALEKVAAEYGIAVKTDGGSIGSTCATLKFQFAVTGADGTVETKERAAFRQLAAMYGLSPEDLGRVFVTAHGSFEIVGLNPNASKNVIHGARVGSGKVYIFPVDVVRRGLERANGPAGKAA